MARGHRAGGREMDSSARRLTTDCCRSASRCDFASSGLRGTGQLPFIVRERTLEGPEDFRKSAAPFDELLKARQQIADGGFEKWLYAHDECWERPLRAPKPRSESRLPPATVPHGRHAGQIAPFRLTAPPCPSSTKPRSSSRPEERRVGAECVSTCRSRW